MQQVASLLYRPALRRSGAGFGAAMLMYFVHDGMIVQAVRNGGWLAMLAVIASVIRAKWAHYDVLQCAPMPTCNQLLEHARRLAQSGAPT